MGTQFRWAAAASAALPRSAAAPELLQELGQQLVDLLKFDDASVRETGAALFADLFAQEPAYYQKFPQLFDPFAAVFRDVSPAVRAKMVEHGVRLAHPPKELPRPPAAVYFLSAPLIAGRIPAPMRVPDADAQN